MFEAVGAHARGDLSEAEVIAIEKTAIPGPGSCGGMYTANTMATAIEALGMSLPGSSAQEAISPEKREDCRLAGQAIRWRQSWFCRRPYHSRSHGRRADSDHQRRRHDYH